MNFSDYFAPFEQYLREEKKSSANTVASYLRDIRSFSQWAEGKMLSVSAVTKADITRYLAHLKRAGKSPATISRASASLRCYFEWLVRLGVSASDPVRGVALERPEKKLPGVLTSAEIELLLEQPDVNEVKGCRDRAMLELLYATGIRVTELITLELSDVILDAGLIRCRTGEKERMIPMYPTAIKFLTDYIRVVRPSLLADEQEPVLFVNMNGQPMSRQGFWKLIKHYQTQAGIEKDITPHTLRHSFAAHLLENGADLKSLQEMLGHADIASTQVYSRVVKKQLKDIYNKAHPKA